ncbi:hypothetical protein JMJ77_0013725 [Colletotrichum scovillei]|uniref:Uncharacterized protein n=1 Tax=Colletotrichum scovillei TaxID=1209932 RepID=A0A9P7R241_9PEZI|nr:hypothetical protein JMJ77_0013725 [Colletotrichum scovillei]KAG7065241.1 hypothetical protein JMJ78_0012000 [Colletotrichum scovillei]KAG7067843.1 hypothetical protein JMJ76_0007545 [Colletotrichum scovillei]
MIDSVEIDEHEEREGRYDSELGNGDDSMLLTRGKVWSMGGLRKPPSPRDGRKPWKTRRLP